MLMVGAVVVPVDVTAEWNTIRLSCFVQGKSLLIMVFHPASDFSIVFIFTDSLFVLKKSLPSVTALAETPAFVSAEIKCQFQLR